MTHRTQCIVNGTAIIDGHDWMMDELELGDTIRRLPKDTTLADMRADDGTFPELFRDFRTNLNTNRRRGQAAKWTWLWSQVP